MPQSEKPGFEHRLRLGLLSAGLCFLGLVGCSSAERKHSMPGSKPGSKPKVEAKRSASSNTRNGGAALKFGGPMTQSLSSDPRDRKDFRQRDQGFGQSSLADPSPEPIMGLRDSPYHSEPHATAKARGQKVRTAGATLSIATGSSFTPSKTARAACVVVRDGRSQDRRSRFLAKILGELKCFTRGVALTRFQKSQDLGSLLQHAGERGADYLVVFVRDRRGRSYFVFHVGSHDLLIHSDKSQRRAVAGSQSLEQQLYRFWMDA